MNTKVEDNVSQAIPAWWRQVGEPVELTNTEFLEVVFINKAEGEVIFRAVKFTHPGQIKYPGRDFVPGRENVFDLTKSNHFCISVLKNKEAGATKKNCAATHVIMLDDIGTKIPLERLPKIPPDYVIETSPGNHQLGYLILPEYDLAKVDKAINAFAKAGLTDGGAIGVARLARLPQGVNTKNSFKGILRYWKPGAPDNRYTLDQLIDILALDLTEKTHSTKSTSSEEWSFIIEQLDSRSLILSGPSNSGWYAIECPWSNEHSDQNDYFCGFIPPKSFKCHHEHCVDRTSSDFVRVLGLKVYTPKDAHITTIEEFNKTHAVYTGEKFFGLTHRSDDVTANTGWMFSKWTDFKHSNDHLKIWGTDKKENRVLVPFVDAWKHNHLRRTFRKIVFSKASVANDVINKWKGYTVEPAPGIPWKMFRFIHKVICSGNTKHFRELNNILCAMYQCTNPDDRAKISVVLQGNEGVGKGTFTTLLKSHFHRDNAYYTKDAERLFTRFNEHLIGTVFVVADEAFFGGDKKYRGPLNALITEPEFDFEIKNGPVGQFDNFMNLFILANVGWNIPLGMDPRRFFMLRVSDVRKGDYDYYKELREAWADGEKGMFLRIMTTSKINRELFTKVTKTTALFEQKMYSFDGYHAFMYQFLNDCEITRVEMQIPFSDELEMDNPSRVEVDSVVSALKQSVGNSVLGLERSITTTLGKLLKKIGVVKHKPTVNGKLTRVYDFPSVTEMREKFEKIVGQKIEWDSNEVVK